MAKEYKAPKTINKIMMLVNRAGIGPSETLTTRGRRSGEVRKVPVTPIVVDGAEYIVSPYGEVGWVHNARAEPEASLSKGSAERSVRLVEVSDDSAAVVKAYWDVTPVPRPYMDVPGEASLEDFTSVAGRFPVFRVDER